MTNAMPAFTVLVNKTEIGRVNAVSQDQAFKRARALAARLGYSRFEVVADGAVNLDKRAARQFRDSDTSHNGRRAPYATPGFDERRAALIAAHKANA